MAQIKLDFSKMKHLKSDDHSTTLQHPSGHTITLAHKALDPDNQKALGMLAKMAQGGTVKLAEGTNAGLGTAQQPGTPAYKLQHIFDPAQPEAKPSKSSGNAGSFNPKSTQQPMQRPAPTPQPSPEATEKTTSPAAGDVEAPNPASPPSDPEIGVGDKPPQGLAKGGPVKENILDYSKMKRERPEQKTNPTTLNYPQLKEEYKKKNRQPMAEGGHPGESADSCPMCGGGMPNMYAEGTGPEGAQDVTDQTPVGQDTVLAPQTSPQSQGDAQTQNPGVSMANAATPNYADPNEATGQPAGTGTTLAPAATPDTQPQAPQAPKQIAPPTPIQHFQMAKEQTAQTMQQEVNNFDNDLYKGHIQPQTYSSLFANKSTLGKIGTMFGMLLSGAGSGMAHQQNAMLNMMDNQISNDLKAQTTSAANAQNFYKLHQQDQMNRANVANTQADTNIKAYTLAQANMLQASYHTLVQNTAKMPEGPLKQQAQATLAMMYQKIGDKINNSVDAAAGASAYNQMLFGNQPQNAPNQDQETQFKDRVQGLRVLGTPQSTQMADQLEARHIAGIPGAASRPIPEDTRNQLQAMNLLDAKGKDLMQFMDKHMGSFNPQTIGAAKQKVEEMKNFYNNSIKGGALTEGRLGWYDEQFPKDPTSIVNNLMRGGTSKLKEMINSNATRRDSELKNLGFPETKTDKNGNRWMRGPDGKTPIPIK